jgi:hypothetical protein
VFNTHIGDETEHTAIGEVELVILVRAPLADVVHKFKFIELIFRALLDVGMLDVVLIELILVQSHRQFHLLVQSDGLKLPKFHKKMTVLDHSYSS